MDQDSWFLYDSSDYFRINSWFFECLVEVFKANVVKVLLTHEDAIVRLPTADEATLFATMINQKYPLITNCWGAMDGLKLTLQRAGNETQQNNFYNGWTHEHNI